MKWPAALRRRLRRVLAAQRRHAESACCADPQAYRRARTLLRRCLTPTQRREFDRLRAFTVHGASGAAYRIGYGSTLNIEVLGPSGEAVHRLCAGPSDLPIPAVMLAQKLMLEKAEDEFLRIAARHPAVPELSMPWRRRALSGA